MPKKKSKSTSKPENESKTSRIDEFQWEEMRETIGEALEFRTPIRIEIASKLEQKVLEGVPEVKGESLYISSQHQRVKIPLERMVSVSAL